MRNETAANNALAITARVSYADACHLTHLTASDARASQLRAAYRARRTPPTIRQRLNAWVMGLPVSHPLVKGAL